ncbi:MAG: ParB/RepB/Spo0J family partition protein [Conexivisphaerales archaeon]
MLKQVEIGLNESVELNVSEIDAESFVIRSDFGNLEELADSINSLGLIEPLIVRERQYGERMYQLLAGHRRFRACKMLGMKKVKAIVVNVTEKDAYLIAISENVQRKSLNPLEEAMAYANYVHKKGWGGLSELAKNIGKSPTYIHMMIGMLDLPSEIQEMVAEGKLKPFVAAELTRVKDEEQMQEIVNKIRENRPSMRQLRSIIKEQRMLQTPKETYLRVVDEMVISTRSCLINYDMSVNKLEGKDEYYNRAISFRYRLHQLLDELINERASVRNELELSGDNV